MTYQRLTPEGTPWGGAGVAAICAAEPFEGHALTARMRLERLDRGGRPADAHAAARD